MHTFYINLDRRTDRRAEIESELASKGIVAERFPAIEFKPPAIGCTLSHISVLTLARDRCYESVMIFEDDFQFLVDKPEWDDLIAKLPPSYDVVMLSYNIERSTPHDDTFLRTQSVHTASGYIVHSRFYETLITRLYDGAQLFIQSPHLDWLYINDQYWKALQPDAEWFAYKVRIGQQRPGFSDLSQRYVDYGC
jgi:glycosyl transferase family 25